MRRAVLAVVVGQLALASSCASSSSSTGAARAAGGACALASIYAQKHVDAAMVPVQGGAELNDWGAAVVEESLPDTLKRLEAALKCRFLPVEAVVASSAYDDVPQDADPSKWTAVKGMRPVVVSGAADAPLAALARDVGVDAVVVVRAAFALQMSADDDIGSNRQFGAADFVAFAVAPDGKRLFDSSQIAESPTYAFTLGDVPSELQAGALEKEAKRLSKIALGKGIDGLAAAQ